MQQGLREKNNGLSSLQQVEGMWVDAAPPSSGAPRSQIQEPPVPRPMSPVRLHQSPTKLSHAFWLSLQVVIKSHLAILPHLVLVVGTCEEPRQASLYRGSIRCSTPLLFPAMHFFRGRKCGILRFEMAHEGVRLPKKGIRHLLARGAAKCAEKRR
eukprot:6189146-Pleurochrysis_carterae.AAC.4